MSGKLFFIVSVLGIGGFYGYKASNYDPTIFPYSKEQVQSMLTDAKTSLPRRDGDGTIEIWSPGSTASGVKLHMKYDTTAPLLDCEAVITELATDSTRVVPECGGGGSGSALSDTTDAIQVPMFQEHILSILNKREFDRETVSKQEMAVAWKNMGGMQREALKTADEMQRSSKGSGQ
jgi:hypothetical protein